LPPISTCPHGMVSVPGGIPGPGSFHPGARVDPFCLATAQVTVREYEACVAAGRCTGTRESVAGLPGQGCPAGFAARGADDAVDCVDYVQAGAYCAWVGARLPMAEELLWAAQSGERAWPYPWGNAAPDGARGHRCGPIQQSRRAVGSSPAGDNALGIHDLFCAVDEWAGDAEFDGAPGHGSAPVRGGARGSMARSYPERGRMVDLGFRCAASPPSPHSSLASPPVRPPSTSTPLTY
jgi:formylglycine-generating enzyme required for sulfatase activity